MPVRASGSAEATRAVDEVPLVPLPVPLPLVDDVVEDPPPPEVVDVVGPPVVVDVVPPNPLVVVVARVVDVVAPGASVVVGPVAAVVTHVSPPGSLPLAANVMTVFQNLSVPDGPLHATPML